MPNLLPAIVRTVVPFVVGWLISLPLVVRIEDLFNVPQENRGPALARLLTVALGAAYYVAVAYLEKHRAAFGWLLGLARQPIYVAPVTSSGAHSVTSLPASDLDADLSDAPDNAGGSA